MTFSRRADREKVPVVLTPIIKETLKFLRASLPATIKISARYDAVHSSVLGDATQLYQVMMNLCTNAAHAMGGKGGMLDVKLSPVSFESIDLGQRAELKPGPHIMLRVQDSGCGMAPDVVARIFDPFYTTKRQGEGTGLGLAVVHGIVKDMDGAISVTSQIGEGTLFRVYFPCYEEKTEYPISEKSTHMARGKGRILFIDDEKPLVDFAREVLTELGFEAVAHTSSPEALEQFRQQPDRFDLVIADVIMPDLTGLELAEAIMKLRPGVPVILCSGFGDPDMANRAKEMGIKDFIRKPFGVREFAETVRRVIDE